MIANVQFREKLSCFFFSICLKKKINEKVPDGHQYQIQCMRSLFCYTLKTLKVIVKKKEEKFDPNQSKESKTTYSGLNTYKV